MNGTDPKKPHYSEQFQDIYYSVDDGLQESRHVFVEPNEIRQRSASLPVLKVGELGFGTGLNFLSTWQAWKEAVGTRADRRLVFYSFEKYPLSREDVDRTFLMWPELEPMRKEFVNQYRFIQPGFHALNMDGGRVRLVLMIGDACGEIRRLSEPMHAWYLDGFAPKKNPEMWSEEIFRQVRRLSGPGTTLTTFTVAGWVRRNLQAAGFRVEKRQGFSFKREMTWAEAAPVGAAFEASDAEVGVGHTSRKVALGWKRPQPELFALESREAIVIGGGIAGLAISGALRHRGWKTIVIEKEERPLKGTSSNPAGAFYPMSGSPGLPLSECANQAFSWTARRWAFQEEGAQKKWRGQNEGVVEVIPEGASEEVSRKWLEGVPNDLARWVNPEEASELAGVRLNGGGLHYPGAGWVNFPDYAKSLFEGAAFSGEGIGGDQRFVVGNQEALNIERPTGSPFWSVYGAAGRFIARAPVLILANGTQVRQFDATSWLPVLPVRGQVMWAEAENFPLRVPVLGDGYCLPVGEDLGESGSTVLYGSTYDHSSSEAEMRGGDFEKLSARLGKMFEDGQQKLKPTERGWAGVRCAMPDRTPIIGAIPDIADYCEAYRDLHYGMKRGPFRTPDRLPGLYVFTGLGSKGLVFSGWGAEYLANLVTGGPLGLQTDLCAALDPERFLVRRLRRPI